MSTILDPHNAKLWCTVNGEQRQRGCTSDMVFPIQTLISFISRYITLEPGDLILTGSPPGMGPVVNGDVVECGIEGITRIKFTVNDEC